MREGVVYERGGVKVSAFEVDHGDGKQIQRRDASSTDSSPAPQHDVIGPQRRGAEALRRCGETVVTLGRVLQRQRDSGVMRSGRWTIGGYQAMR